MRTANLTFIVNPVLPFQKRQWHNHGRSFSDPHDRNTMFPHISLILKTSLCGSEVQYQRNFNRSVRVNCFSSDYSGATNPTVITPLTAFQRASMQLLSKPGLSMGNPEQAVLSCRPYAQNLCSSQTDPAAWGEPSPLMEWGQLSPRKHSQPGKIIPSGPRGALSSSRFLKEQKSASLYPWYLRRQLMSLLKIQTCLQKVYSNKICICTAFAQQASAEIPVVPNANSA